MKLLSFSISHTLLIIIFIVELVVSQDDPFKINKLNLIWIKAQHSLGQDKLKTLKGELEKHEQDELSLKKMKAHNQDKDGLFEATTRKKLLSILIKYSLERYYEDVHPQVGSDDNSKDENLNLDKLKSSNPVLKMKPSFRDKKLDKLWKKAELSEFTQEQLMVLFEEFQHQQDKLDEHYETMNQFEEKRKEHEHTGEERWENSIENPNEKYSKRHSDFQSSKETSSEKKLRLDSNIHQSLKDKYSDIKKNYNKLHEKIANKKVNDQDSLFEEEAVNILWNEAIEAKFSPDELDSFKEELAHYEVRIKKLKHFQNELERDKISSKESSSNFESNSETKHLKKKVKELALKVEKVHKSLKQRISSERDEL